MEKIDFTIEDATQFCNRGFQVKRKKPLTSQICSFIVVAIIIIVVIIILVNIN